MELPNPISTEEFLPGVSLQQLTALRSITAVRRAGEDLTDQQKKQIAKDFESIFLNRLFDEMSKTVGDWGFERDGAAEQVQGLFWFYLAKEVADKGGFGLWRDIYRWLAESEQTPAEPSLVDRKI